MKPDQYIPRISGLDFPATVCDIINASGPRKPRTAGQIARDTPQYSQELSKTTTSAEGMTSQIVTSEALLLPN